MPKRAKAVKPRASQQSHQLDITVAMLEQQVKHVAQRFDETSNTFIRILGKMEELSLHTTTLNTRHDTEIQVLQKQLSSTQTLLNQTRDDIADLATKLNSNLTKELSTTMNEVSAAIDELSERIDKKHAAMDRRITTMERWRYYLLGAGAVAAVVLGWFVLSYEQVLSHLASSVK